MSFANHQIEVAQRRIHLSVAQFPESNKTIIFGPAMGVKSSFYQTIASYFNEHGFNCLLFDYHGMFFEVGSREATDIAAFGRTDLASVIDYATAELQTTDLFFIGHSVSGQVLPLAPNANAFKAAYLVASQSVDVTNWSGRSRLAANAFWNILIPAAVTLYPYLPSWVYGGKHHLSKSVARDWARLAKSQGGIAEDSRYNTSRYRAFTVPTKFVSIEGDNLLAPKKAVAHLYQQYGSPIKNLHHQSAASSKHLDHFSFFKKHNQHLWSDILIWFETCQSVQDLINSPDKYVAESKIQKNNTFPTR